MGSVGPNSVESGVIFVVDAKNPKVENERLSDDTVALFNDTVAMRLESSDNIFDKGAENFSFGCWFKSTNTGDSNQFLLNKHQGSTQYSYTLKFGIDTLTVQISSDGTTNNTGTNWASKTHSATISDNTWHYGVFSYDYDNGLLGISVDGLPFETTAQTLGANPGSARDLMIGWTTNTITFHGEIKNTFMYNRVMTNDEVFINYCRGRGMNYEDLEDWQKVDLLSWWNLNDGSGDATDQHGGYTLTNVNTVTSTTDTDSPFTLKQDLISKRDYCRVNGMDVIDGAYEFDGVNDYIDFGDVNTLDLNVEVDSLTMEAWVKTSDGGTQGVITKTNSAGGPGWEFSLNARLVNTVFRQNGSALINTQTNGFSIPSNEWAHICITKTIGLLGNTVVSYINGISVPTTILTNTLVAGDLTSSSSVRVGDRELGGGTNRFEGQISQAKIYSKTLTASEVLKNYNETKYRFR